MTKAMALDLFCGAGGASMGLWRSGLFDMIVGIDDEPQPDYPFDFVYADALEEDIASYSPDFVWASPPCQRHVTLVETGSTSHTLMTDYEDLVAPTRELLSGFPWHVIENVSNAPVRPDIRLEGGNVGIPNMKRRRHFEVSWNTLSPKPFTEGYVLHKVYGRGGTRDKATVARRVAAGLPKTITVAEVQELWDVRWTSDWDRLTEMVPPAYATYIVRDAASAGFR